MQLIAVDVGNTAIKILVAHPNPKLKKTFTLPNRSFTPSQLGQLKLPHLPVFWALCSVNQGITESIRNWIEQHRPTDMFHDIQPDDVPMECDVQSLQQLGRDRLLAAWTAFKENANRSPVIVVDGGTAVTIDLVDQAGVFRGGLIFPGLESALMQLTQNTAALPNLVDYQSRQRGLQQIDKTHQPQQPLGKSTEMAILKGVFQSQIAAITGIIDGLLAQYQLPETTPIFLTGGGIAELLDSQQYLPTKFPSQWRYVANLVLLGAVKIGQQLISK